MAQNKVCRGVATSVATDADGTTRATYHNTVVVEWDAHKVVLNSGGHQTVTTKRRMTQASNQFGLGYAVYQRGHSWYVDHNGETHPFRDGMVLLR